MTINDMVSALSLHVINAGDMEQTVTQGYCGDLLSWVMGRAPHGCVWVTIMSNRNVIAVASLAEIPAIIFAEDVKPDDDALERAREEGITLLGTSLSTFELTGRLYAAMEQKI